MRKFLIISLCLICFVANAQEKQIINPTGRDFTLISLLRLTDTVIGEVEVTVTKDQQILLPATASIELLSKTFNDDLLTKLAELQVDGMVSQHHFAQLGVELTFEMSTLELVMQAPTNTLKVGEINFANNVHTRKFIAPSNLNGYVNLSALATRSESNEPDNSVVKSYAYTLDSGFNFKRAVLEYESIYSDTSESEGYYARQGTRLNYDFPGQGTRLTFGDIYTSGATFQDNGDILGVSISRDFSVIPTRNVRPTAARQFTLQRASSVDVVVDGVVVRRLTLGAGSYNLQDIPLAEGVSDLELVIIDNNGKQERISFSIATGMDLLKSGEFEYNFNGGMLSEVSSGNPEYSHDNFIVNAGVEYGINASYTLGGNFQFSNDAYQVGYRSLFATELGIFDLKTNYSYQEILGEGVATSLGYDLIGDTSEVRNLELSLYYDYYSRFFTGVRGDYDELPISAINANQHYFSSRLSYNFSSYLRLSLTANYVQTYDEDDRYWAVSPSFSGSLFNTNATWSIRGTHKQFVNNHSEFSGLVILSWSFASSSKLVSTYKTDEQEVSTEYSYRDNVGNTGGISMYAGAVHSKESNLAGDFGLEYDANRFTFDAEHNSRYIDFSEDTNRHLSRAQFATGLAFSGDKVAIGRPVRESFAIVSQHQSIKDNRTEISPSRSGPRVHSDAFGAMLIPDLAAYSEQMLTYDVDNLPAGYDLGAGVFLLNPGYSQGYNLQIGSSASITVMGSLINSATKQPITLVSGTATLFDRTDLEPLQFFTNRSGRFAITGMRPGTYQLKLNTQPAKYHQIVIQEESNTLLRLGEIYVD